MRIRSILTTAAVSAALVAGGIAGPATAAGTPVAGGVSLGLGPVSAISSFDKPQTALNIVGTGAYVHFFLVQNGVPVETYKTFVYSAGYGAAADTTTVDLVGALQGTSYSSQPLAAGSYTFYATVDANDTYTNNVATSYSAAQSPTYTLNVSKTKTKITGWKTKSKSARYGKLIKTSSPTIKNYNTGADVVFQYKTSKKGKWKTSEVSRGSSYPTNIASIKFKTKAFNTIKKRSKPVKRGTYYFRVLIKETPFSTKAVTKQIKLTWR